MYNVKTTHHFEDWYVGWKDIGEYNLFEDAFIAFYTEYKRISTCDDEASGLRAYISDELQFDEKELKDCGCGVCVEIYRDDDESIIFYYFEYNYTYNSLKQKGGMNINWIRDEELAIIERTTQKSVYELENPDF